MVNGSPQWMVPGRVLSTRVPADLLQQRENTRMARLSTEAPRIPFDRFEVYLHGTVRQGQHFGLIGPTGQGKTTMLMHLVELFKYITVFATKPRDSTMDTLIAQGYLRMEHWYSLDPEQYPKRVLWPDASRLDSREHQARVFHHAFGAIYHEGGWAVGIDETWYMMNILKLGEDIKVYLLQARALGITLICATQRPASVPLEIYDQSTHLMFWRDNDEANLKRLAGISWRSADLIRGIIANLEEHQVLYVNTRTGQMFRTRCPAPILTAGGR